MTAPTIGIDPGGRTTGIVFRRGEVGSIVDLFAGPGGWSEGLRMIGRSDVGIEINADACRTRAAAGHLTIRADVSAYPAERFRGAEGLIASPPCPDYSVAGKGAGRTGDSGWLIDIVPLWVEQVRPRWIACEQVPPCLEIWREHAELYRHHGYSVWVGVLNAADFGVPQTRRRAFLLASLDRAALPPAPTHAAVPTAGLFDTRLPWVSMADALGWDPLLEVGVPRLDDIGDSPDGYRERDFRTLDRPALEKARSWTVRSWPWVAPATTVAGDPRISARCHHESGTQGADARTTAQVEAGDYGGTQPIRLGVPEALALQSFPRDYPIQGTRTAQFQQIGNAVPPLLAAHVIGALTGQTLELAA